MNPNNFRKLWYNQPAEKWVDALPVGNGRLGGMVFGGVEQERIQLNEDTLWSGRPKDKQNYQAIDYLAEVRELLFKGEYREAQDIIEQKMLGGYSEAYQPMGDLYLDFQLKGQVTNYRRELDLNEAVSKVSYTVGEVNYKRTVFSSKPDQVMVVHLTSDQPSQLNFCL